MYPVEGHLHLKSLWNQLYWGKKENTWHALGTAFLQVQWGATARNTSSSQFLFGGGKEDCNIYPTCRPFRVLPKGQGFVLSESKCWQVGSHWEQRWRLGLPCIHSPQPLSPFQWKRGGENLQLLTSPWGRKKLECASEITTFQGLPEIWVYVSPVLERWQDLAYSRCLGIT